MDKIIRAGLHKEHSHTSNTNASTVRHVCAFMHSGFQATWFFNLHLGFCLEMQMQAEMRAQVLRQELKHFPFLASLLAFVSM